MYALSVDDQVQQGKLQRVDIMHYHISPKGHFQGNWPKARENYRRLMRHPDSINFITMMREPRSHFLRYKTLRAQAFVLQILNDSSCESTWRRHASSSDD